MCSLLVLNDCVNLHSSIFLTSPLWLILHNTAAARHKTEFSRFKTTDRLIHATVGTLAIAGVFLVGTMLNPHHEIFAQATNQPHASLTAPLGDLGPFQLIAEDTLRIVKTGDLRAAKTRIRDLEAAWDSAEGKLRRMNPDTWKSVDKAIDRALSQLRSGKPDSAECIAALDALIAKCKSFSK